jgi:hypothetical protein
LILKPSILCLHGLKPTVKRQRIALNLAYQYTQFKKDKTMKTYKMTYAIYWEVEVQAEDEADAYEIGKDQIPNMTVGSGDFLLAESEITA